MPGRVIREEKKRRRKWAQNITPRPSNAREKSQDISGTKPQQEPNTAAGFLPDNIVQMLAAQEKYVTSHFLLSNYACDCFDKFLTGHDSFADKFSYLTLMRRKMT